jgi:GT2 family glycosyltransferase
MKEKIGVGIITTGTRGDTFKKCFGFFKYSPDEADEIVVIVDGEDVENLKNFCLDDFKGDKNRFTLIANGNNLGVGKSKNKALKHLLDKGCQHLFLIEDDIYVKRSSVFRKYIESSKISGIQHFNFSQHGMMNKTFDGRSTPNPRIIINYWDVKIPLYPHCVGAFSYYTRHCLDEVGLMDERYYNACEHVDHTLEIIKEGMHPPFWYFADIENSWEYLGDEEWSIEQSTISSKSNHRELIKKADVIFREKHGCLPGDIKLSDIGQVGIELKRIKENYG